MIVSPVPPANAAIHLDFAETKHPAIDHIDITPTNAEGILQIKINCTPRGGHNIYPQFSQWLGKIMVASASFLSKDSAELTLHQVPDDADTVRLETGHFVVNLTLKQEALKPYFDKLRNEYGVFRPEDMRLLRQIEPGYTDPGHYII